MQTLIVEKSDVAKALAVGHLRKGHRQKLIAARKASVMSIPAITLDALLKLVKRQVVHELGEDGLAAVPPSLLEIRAGCAPTCAELQKSKDKSKSTNWMY